MTRILVAEDEPIARMDLREMLENLSYTVVGEAGEIRDRLACELGDVSAGELVLGGSALLAAAVFGLAA